MRSLKEIRFCTRLAGSFDKARVRYEKNSTNLLNFNLKKRTKNIIHLKYFRAIQTQPIVMITSRQNMRA